MPSEDSERGRFTLVDENHRPLSELTDQELLERHSRDWYDDAVLDERWRREKRRARRKGFAQFLAVVMAVAAIVFVLDHTRLGELQPVMTIKAFTGENYSENAARVTGENYPCVICGREVKGSLRWLVRLDTSSTIHSVDAVNLGADDMGCYPIGADCLRQHPEIKPLAKRFSYPFKGRGW